MEGRLPDFHHCNYIDNLKIRGSEHYFHPRIPKEFQDFIKDGINYYLARQLYLVSAGVFSPSNNELLNTAKMPATITKIGYVSNELDAHALIYYVDNIAFLLSEAFPNIKPKP